MSRQDPETRPFSSPVRIEPGQTLLFDADDTLWENNCHFETAIDGFVDLLNHPSLSPAEVRDAFNALERRRVLDHGYGVNAFQASMRVALEELSGNPCDEDAHSRLQDIADAVRLADPRVLPGVSATLSVLKERHRLIVVTKGDHAEQTSKLKRSGLAPHFSAVEVLREKHEEAYRDISSRHALNPARTWMIGNSPKSDVNPALAAGLNAIYLPHHCTWTLEMESLATAPVGQHLFELPGFAHLSALL